MSAREFLWIVKESALGTVMTSPSAGVDSIYIRLVDGNSFSMVAEPMIEEIPYGGGFAVTAEAVSDHYGCKGQLKTKLYPSQAKLLLALLTERINSGQTTPWVTTEPPGDLASVSIYHAVRRSDGTYRRKRFGGVKAAGGSIEVSRQSTTAMITLDLQACTCSGNSMDSSSDPDATEFPAPAETDYPTGPYTFTQTTGRLICHTSGSAVRSQYEDVSVKIQNALDGQWFEAPHLTVNQFCGRSTTLDATLYLKATPDDRSAYEAITTNVVSLAFSTGVTGFTKTLIDFSGSNHITKLPYDLPLNQVFKQKLSLKNRWNVSAAADVTVTVSVEP